MQLTTTIQMLKVLTKKRGTYWTSLMTQNLRLTISQSKKHEADEAPDEAFRIIKESYIQIQIWICSMSNPRLASALHCFGYDNSSYSLKITKAVVRNVKRNKIKVQPEAVKRRKTANGSRQKQSKRNHQEFRS